jgi:hypothetical protein
MVERAVVALSRDYHRTRLAVLWIISLRALWRVRPFAPNLYLVSIAIGILITAFIPVVPRRTTAVEQALYGVQWLISGLIVAVTKYSPVAELFRTNVSG